MGFDPLYDPYLYQVPIGLETGHCGVVDLVKNKAYFFEGFKGLDVILQNKI